MVIRRRFNGLDFTNCWNYRCDCILVLCIGIVVVLISVKNLDHVAKTLDGVEGQVQGITRETTDLLHKANRLTEDIQGKVERLNSVVDGVKGIGDSVQNLNGSVDVTNSITHNISQNEDKISQVVQWSNVAMEIADKWQNRHYRRGSANYRNTSVGNDANHSNENYTTNVEKNF